MWSRSIRSHSILLLYKVTDITIFSGLFFLVGISVLIFVEVTDILLTVIMELIFGA